MKAKAGVQVRNVFNDESFFYEDIMFFECLHNMYLYWMDEWMQSNVMVGVGMLWLA